jgi:rubredoxin
MTGFERVGGLTQIGQDTRMECSVCWYVYDPAEGDVAWQVPAGTPFTALPPHWSCPSCSATKDRFLVVTGDDRPG